MGHAVAGDDRGIDGIDIDHPASVIQSHIDAPEMSAFCEHPHGDRLKAFVRPSTNHLLRENHMDFLWRALGRRPNPSKTPVMLATNPTAAIALKAFLIRNPIAADDGHGLFGACVRNCETQPTEATGPSGHEGLLFALWKLRPRFTERGLIVRARRRRLPAVARFVH